MISALRVLGRGAWLGLHIAVAFPMALFIFRRPRHDAVLQQRLFRWWLAGVCRILRVRVVTRGLPQEDGFVVCNHVSWLDIPVLASVWHGRFLAKAEVGAWPVIGWLVRRTGTALIRRGCAISCAQAIARLSGQLRRGGGVCVFPEGTTTDGRGMRRFQPRLFEVAIRADARVQPVALRYLDAEGRLHPTAPFIGDDDFIAHVLRLLRGPPLKAELVFLPPLSAQGQSARRLAESAQARVSAILARKSGRIIGEDIGGIGAEALAESRPG